MPQGASVTQYAVVRTDAGGWAGGRPVCARSLRGGAARGPRECLQHRPAASRPGPSHPIQAYLARPKAVPTGHRLDPGHYRVRHDRIDPSGVITLRHNSRLHHIGIGRRHAGTDVLVLVHDLHIRVLDSDGNLLRDLTLDPARDYQPRAQS